MNVFYRVEVFVVVFFPLKDGVFDSYLRIHLSDILTYFLLEMLYIYIFHISMHHTLS